MLPAKQDIFLFGIVRSLILQNQRLGNYQNFQKRLKVGTYFAYSPSMTFLCTRDTLQSDLIRLVKPLSSFSSLCLGIDSGLFVARFINSEVANVWFRWYYLLHKPCYIFVDAAYRRHRQRVRKSYFSL